MASHPPTATAALPQPAVTAIRLVLINPEQHHSTAGQDDYEIELRAPALDGSVKYMLGRAHTLASPPTGPTPTVMKRVNIDTRVLSRSHVVVKFGQPSVVYNATLGTRQHRLYVRDAGSSHGSFIQRAAPFSAKIPLTTKVYNNLAHNDVLILGRELSKDGLTHRPLKFRVRFIRQASPPAFVPAPAITPSLPLPVAPWNDDKRPSPSQTPPINDDAASRASKESTVEAAMKPATTSSSSSSSGHISLTESELMQGDDDAQSTTSQQDEIADADEEDYIEEDDAEEEDAGDDVDDTTALGKYQDEEDMQDGERMEYDEHKQAESQGQGEQAGEQEAEAEDEVEGQGQQEGADEEQDEEEEDPDLVGEEESADSNESDDASQSQESDSDSDSDESDESDDATSEAEDARGETNAPALGDESSSPAIIKREQETPREGSLGQCSAADDGGERVAEDDSGEQGTYKPADEPIDAAEDAVEPAAASGSENATASDSHENAGKPAPPATLQDVATAPATAATSENVTVHDPHATATSHDSQSTVGSDSLTEAQRMSYEALSQTQAPTAPTLASAQTQTHQTRASEEQCNEQTFIAAPSTPPPSAAVPSEPPSAPPVVVATTAATVSVPPVAGKKRSVDAIDDSALWGAPVADGTSAPRGSASSCARALATLKRRRITLSTPFIKVKVNTARVKDVAYGVAFGAVGTFIGLAAMGANMAAEEGL